MGTLGHLEVENGHEIGPDKHRVLGGQGYASLYRIRPAQLTDSIFTVKVRGLDVNSARKTQAISGLRTLTTFSSAANKAKGSCSVS